MNRPFSEQGFEHRRTTIRFALIGVIVLAMLIPLAMVEGVTEERRSFLDMTMVDIGNSWGNAQGITGPFLVIPEVHRYRVQSEDGEQRWREHTYQRVHLPGELALQVEVTHQIRKRAIYEVPVYSARIRFAGEFPALEASYLNRSNVKVLLDQARIVTGISHTQAISSASELQLGALNVPFESGTGQQWIGSGIHAQLEAYPAADRQPFEFELELKGTRQLGFTPVGGSTEVVVESSWPHPSFDGAYLPERYDIREDGFSASWMVHELARDLPSSWRVDQKEMNLAGNFAWISLFQPVTDYTIVDRAIKYGLLFIALTFLAFVCFELRTSLRFHPVQYGVVGIALVLFYLALLSLSEHLDFGLSYLIATGVLTALVGWYVWAMTGIARLSGVMVGILVALYGSLFVLLKLEAFALLVGTAVLFAGLAALMASTRSLTVATPAQGEVAV